MSTESLCKAAELWVFWIYAGALACVEDGLCPKWPIVGRLSQEERLRDDLPLKGSIAPLGIEADPTGPTGDIRMVRDPKMVLIRGLRGLLS